MKLIFLFFSILIFTFCFGDICDKITSASAEFNLKLSKVGEEFGWHHIFNIDDTKYYDVSFFSNGVLRLEGQNKRLFKIGSKFRLENDVYTVKSCSYGILETKKMGDLYYFEVFSVTKSEDKVIISDPINQLNDYISFCNILSHKGEYTITLKNDYGVDFETKFYVNKIQLLNYYFIDMNVSLVYDNAYLQNDRNERDSVHGCKSYANSNSKLQLNDKSSYLIVDVKEKNEISDYRNGLCGILSVKGSYSIIYEKKIIGTFDVISQPHTSILYYNPTENVFFKFKLQYDVKSIFPKLKSDSRHYSISSCFENKDGSYMLVTNGLDRFNIYFDDVKVINQDTEYLLNRKEKHEKYLEEMFHLSKPIDDEEIRNLFLDLGISPDIVPDKFCYYSAATQKNQKFLLNYDKIRSDDNIIFF